MFKLLTRKSKQLCGAVLEDTSLSGKLAALDGLRGVAVLTVFLSHANGREIVPFEYLSFHGMGHIGVYLFFVISGYLLAHSLIKTRPAYKQFFIRRFLRIYPLYALVVCGVYLHQELTNSVNLEYLHVLDGWYGLVKHLLFIKGSSVFWTLTAEFQFYMVMPFIVTYLITNGVRAIKTVSIFILFYGIWYAAIMFCDAPLFDLRLAQINHHSQFVDVFLCGVLAAVICHKQAVADWHQRHKKIIDHTVSVLAVTVAIVSLAAVARRFFIFEQEAFSLRYLSVFYGPVFAVITASVALGHSHLKPVLCFTPLRYMGVVAFGFYLLHFPVFQFVHWITRSMADHFDWLRFILSFFLCAFVATVAYVLVEKPFMKWSKNLGASCRKHLPATLL